MLKLIEEYIRNSLPYYKNVKVLNENEYPKYKDHVFSLVMEGKVTLEGQSVTIQIALDKHFPLYKPLFFLKPYDALGFIAHVDSSGFICYIHDEGLLIDTNNVTGIIEEAFDKVLKTLKDGINGINRKDIQNEFESYWSHLDNTFLIESNIELTNNVKKIKVAKFENYPYYFAGDSISDIMNYCYKYIGKTRMGKPIFIDALYIPLREGTDIIPPSYGTFWTMKKFRHIIYKNVTSSNKKIIEHIVKHKVRSSDVLIVLVSIPLLNGNKAFIGVKYSNFSAIKQGANKRTEYFSHPLYKTDAKCKFVPVRIVRHDKGYIMPRGGGINLLTSKKVALIGCGSVGGYIAVELAKAGVQNITLIDQDTLMQENVYRHTLGVNSLIPERYKNNEGTVKFHSKILGLKREIEEKLPYTNIEVLPEYIDRIENIISNNIVDFWKYDLVIVAIGNPTIELYINEYFHKKNGMPPVIFTWLEAYGIGGHAILTNNNNKNGCLKCLYTDPFDKQAPLYNRASFAAAGQFFAKQISGCGSVYMPYGSIDSMQTAIVATRLAIDVLIGKEKDNPILSWKGNADLFLDNGFKLSEYYFLTNENLFNSRYLYKNDFCDICGNLKGV
ncbi:ThiF family adenylyltransferase [Clostridium thermopalmarium]|uniref:Thiamine biosynthesis protein ThiF n=2 Tax=Clostridium TaxID=1485 RepID=A0A2T0AMM7_9CLOT|nr:E2/UBC family protein [Clostridium thermopalmarium]PRR70131.1 thiamine biosynthesis protein ThiF [Clostridium thermopalmarium DSM 5974]PVZ23146.1 E2/UBC family protein B [Clostridium thermopalmarium DSM 5974]